MGNLSESATEDTLREFFAACGEITDIRVNPKGFAHIEFSSPEEAAKAISDMNQQDFEGK